MVLKKMIVDLSTFDGLAAIFSYLVVLGAIGWLACLLLMDVVFDVLKCLRYRRYKAKIKEKFNISDFNIKPCPFCGNKHVEIVNKHFLKFEEFAIKCSACDAGTPFGCAGYIVGIWNNRANKDEV